MYVCMYVCMYAANIMFLPQIRAAILNYTQRQGAAQK